MLLYPYQQRVKDALHRGQSVILQAPTGSGKTRAALAPFVEAFFDFPPACFPRQCLYAVPVQSLAVQFERVYRELAESYERRFCRRLEVRIQTGEFPEDPKLMGDLVFATLDQVLSSALGVPYSLSSNQANVNVGAVLGSYLVFDEFHLFPPAAIQTTLQLLCLYGRWAPFILMTATFSRTMLEEAAALLGAQVEIVPPEEVAQIETGWGTLPRRERRFFWREKVLSAADVLRAHGPVGRSLAVCNTVERALNLYRALVEAGCRPVPVASPALESFYEALRHATEPEKRHRILERAVGVLREEMAGAPTDSPWVMLLHSRFERPHRQVKEAFLGAECGSEREKWQVGSLIVVATQVVEVGLDITSGVLHTELAPAASVLQRAGRCARYPGERGEVYVYEVPARDDGKPDTAPYLSREEQAICERTRQALRERTGEILDFAQEQEIVNAAHQEVDRAILQAMREDEGRLWDLIRDGLERGKTSVRPELIRRVDSRTLIVYDAPSGLSEDSPFRYEGFSLWHGSLRGAVRNLLEQAKALDLPWALRYPVVQKDEEDSRAPTIYRWLDVESPEDISRSLLFAVHPALVSYDPEQGFRLVPGDRKYRSPQAPRRRGDRENYVYRLESYVQHVKAMARAFERLFRDRLAWVAARSGLGDHLERAVRLVLALHDVGKLQEPWQKWAAEHQKRVSGQEPPFLVAHVWSETEEHRRIAREVRPARPKHAGEGAFAAARILWEALEGQSHRFLHHAAVTAIARHHSPHLREAAPYRLHPRARETIAEALSAVGGRPEWADYLLAANEAPNLEKRLLPPPSTAEEWEGWLLYFLIVRVLRLCDELSQEEE
ncbi:DEAD/DEAH box helicase [Thermoflexus hugenholtzii]